MARKIRGRNTDLLLITTNLLFLGLPSNCNPPLLTKKMSEKKRKVLGKFACFFKKTGLFVSFLPLFLLWL